MNTIKPTELGKLFYIDFKNNWDFATRFIEERLPNNLNMTLFKAGFLCACEDDGVTENLETIFRNALINFGIEKFNFIEENPLHNIIELTDNYKDVRLLTNEEIQIMYTISSAGSLKEELQIVDPFVLLTYWGEFEDLTPWKSEASCYLSEVDEVLSNTSPYIDYDVTEYDESHPMHRRGFVSKTPQNNIVVDLTGDLEF